jgi:UDP-N-acetylglucosamine 1-carboxyvinyltransferase
MDGKDIFKIKGLSGKRTLEGTIPVSGAKNAALKIMAASLLFSDELVMKNVPDIEDIRRVAELLRDIGFRVQQRQTNTYAIEPQTSIKTSLASDIAKKIRSSMVLTAPLLARCGKVTFPHPGGCVIGARPIDFFLESFERMGATVKEGHDTYVVETKNGKLQGASLFLPVPSVTVTETMLMAGVLAKGTTVIKNAAMEPEIAYLAEFLNSCGAKIQGAGTSTIVIKGVGKLKARGNIYTTMPDRIEAGSFLVLAALAGKDVTISKCNPAHLEAVTDFLTRCNVEIEIKKSSLRVVASDQRRKMFTARNIKTHEYPGFPTDLQAPMTVFLTQAQGESMVHETIFEGRLAYAESLEAMGADITPMDPHRMLIRGKRKLHGKKLESPDLRAGLAFVIAAIIAKGESTVHNVYNIDRGYEAVEKRLQAIGVSIVRETNTVCV